MKLLLLSSTSWFPISGKSFKDAFFSKSASTFFSTDDDNDEDLAVSSSAASKMCITSVSSLLLTYFETRRRFFEGFSDFDSIKDEFGDDADGDVDSLCTKARREDVVTK